MDSCSSWFIRLVVYRSSQPIRERGINLSGVFKRMENITSSNLPWDKFEKKYRHLFKSKTGNVAKLLRMAPGVLIIQKKFQYSDRELVAQITENPYLQYFVGLPGYQETAPFDAGTLVLFRKRITAEMIMEVNDCLLQENKTASKEDDNDHQDPFSGSGSGNTDEKAVPENKGTLIIDATCEPVHIRYPQDVPLLNEAREKLEEIILWFHKTMAWSFPEGTVMPQGRITSILQKQKNIPKNKSGKGSCGSDLPYKGQPELL